MIATLQQHPAYDRQTAASLQKAAVEAWWQPGHPGWTIWPADSEQFMRGVVEPGSPALSPIQISAPMPATPHCGRSELRLQVAFQAACPPDDRIASFGRSEIDHSLTCIGVFEQCWPSSLR